MFLSTYFYRMTACLFQRLPFVTVSRLTFVFEVPDHSAGPTAFPRFKPSGEVCVGYFIFTCFIYERSGILW